MASINDLEKQLSQCKADKRDYESKRETAKAERDKAKARRNKIKEINNNLKQDFDNDVRGTNKVADATSREIEDGIIGISTPSNIDMAIQGDKELEVESDADLKQAISLLDSEYNALQAYYDERVRRIKEYDSKISSLNWEIICLNAEIAEEEAKERAKSLLEKITS